MLYLLLPMPSLHLIRDKAIVVRILTYQIVVVMINVTEMFTSKMAMVGRMVPVT
jgi:hypothetical protein